MFGSVDMLCLGASATSKAIFCVTTDFDLMSQLFGQDGGPSYCSSFGALRLFVFFRILSNSRILDVFQ
eukprot:16437168-Heterocapsa_arctica.AAC.1